LKIKNWGKFQHFKDRRPPWIKLHREILEQRDINVISDCSFRVLVGIWLLASEDERMEGNIPEAEDIAFRLRIDKSKIIKALNELSGFLIQDDIKAISEGYQDDVPDKEREKEKEKEKDDVALVIQYLNKKGGYRFKPIGDNKKLIIARLKDYAIEDLYAVIDFKYAEWKDDPKFKAYIRPKTLFADSNFSSYVGVAHLKPPSKEPQSLAERMKNYKGGNPFEIKDGSVISEQ